MKIRAGFVAAISFAFLKAIILICFACIFTGCGISVLVDEHDKNKPKEETKEEVVMRKEVEEEKEVVVEHEYV